MITQNELWKSIKEELVYLERCRKFTLKVLEKMKDTPQHEDKTRET